MPIYLFLSPPFAKTGIFFLPTFYHGKGLSDKLMEDQAVCESRDKKQHLSLCQLKEKVHPQKVPSEVRLSELRVLNRGII